MGRPEGTANSNPVGVSFSSASGAFSLSQAEVWIGGMNNNALKTQNDILSFNASDGSTSENPTAGHTAEEVRPYSISFPFLIAY